MPTVSSDPSSIDNLPKTFRQGGSGFTAFHWNGKVIGYAQSVSHTSAQPVAPPSFIQPLDQQYPLDIMVPAAIGAGSLQVALFETYNSKVWDQIMGITDTVVDKSGNGVPSDGIYHDLAQVFLRLSALNTPIHCTKIVYPPNAGFRGGPKLRAYADQYYNCKITDIRDDENIEISTMEVVKVLTIGYTYMRRRTETVSNNTL